MSLLDALKSVTQDDLDQVNGRIAELTAELDAMRTAQKLMQVKLGLRPGLGGKRGPRKPKPAQPEHSVRNDQEHELPVAPAVGGYTATERHRLRVREFLMANGPHKQGDIVKLCGIPAGSITAVLRHEWFTTTYRGVELTKSLKEEPS